MKFALTVTSYRFPEFVELNLNRLRAIFGTETPILVADDRSPNSGQIESIAGKYGAAYTCSRVRRGHFAGDLAGIVAGLAFAESHGADVFVKVSFRLILLDPQLRNDFENYFTNMPIDLALPQRLHPSQTIDKRGAGFLAMPLLTDVILFRVGVISPQMLIDLYRKKVATEGKTVKHASFIEALFVDLKHELGPRCMALNELSCHVPGQPHRFLRKIQNHRQQFVDLAQSLGISGPFVTDEWARIDGPNYRPRPLVL